VPAPQMKTLPSLSRTQAWKAPLAISLSLGSRSTLQTNMLLSLLVVMLRFIEATASAADTTLVLGSGFNSASGASILPRRAAPAISQGGRTGPGRSRPSHERPKREGEGVGRHKHGHTTGGKARARGGGEETRGIHQREPPSRSSSGSVRWYGRGPRSRCHTALGVMADKSLSGSSCSARKRPQLPPSPPAAGQVLTSLALPPPAAKPLATRMLRVSAPSYLAHLPAGELGQQLPRPHTRLPPTAYRLPPTAYRLPPTAYYQT